MADFKFFLNRQGVRGNKGEQGEQGYSPRITVKTETAAEYVLNVQNEDDSFDTPNLRGNAIENLGGTYVRFDQDTEQMYTGYADTASTTSKGEVVLSTYADLDAGGNEDEVTTSKDVYDFVEAKISEASVNYVDIDDYTRKMDELDGEISDLDNNKLDFTDLSDTLVAGTNITITPNTQTGKITIAGEPVSQAQADWNQTDTDAPDYIKNKPTIPEAITVDDDFSTTSTNPVENRLITNAINLISNELEDFAEKDLSNLSASGEARLHALKAYSDNGEVLTDTKGLSAVISYAHSTFDSSKFATTGSAVISDSGIASNFSTNDWVNIPNINVANYSTWEVFIPVNLTSDNSIIGFFSIGGSGVKSGVIYNKSATSQKLNFYVYVDSTTILSGYLTREFDLNKEYILSLGYDGSKFEFKLLDGEYKLIDSTSVESAVNIYSGSGIRIGLRQAGTPFTGGISNLKKVRIIGNGVEVFSGNRTGIDTIKPDNYTVADGTPNITADGVFTSTTSNAHNYISLDNFTASGDLRSEFEFSITGGDYDGYLINSGSSKNAGLYTNDYGLTWALFGANNFKGRYYIATGHSYKLYLEWKADGTTELGIKRDDESAYSTCNGTWTGTLPTDFIIGYRYNNQGVAIFDLNRIKFYSGGDLIYQPCLKIPYTESKTGSKIVNSIYRDRVNDMAEQYGYANYYTLDELSGNFTLPQVELYGLIEKAASTVPSGVVQSSSINSIVSLTQAEYDALVTKDANTFYIITPSS